MINKKKIIVQMYVVATLIDLKEQASKQKNKSKFFKISKQNVIS